MKGLPVFQPSETMYGFYVPKYPNGRGLWNDKKIMAQVRKQINNKTKKQMASEMGITYEVLLKACKRLNMGGRYAKRNYTLISKRKIGKALEDYFGNGMQINAIAEKHKISHTTISKYIQKMLPVRMTENCEVLNVKSNIWNDQ